MPAYSLTNAHSVPSFITSDLARQLELVHEREEIISLSAFDGTSTSVKRVEVATIHLQPDQGGTIPIETIIVPTIATPLQNQATVHLQDLPHLQGLKLAHPISDEDLFEIDLLIGADHYWNIVEDHIVRGCGPTAAKSKIGYLLSGPVPSVGRYATPQTSILHVMTAHKQDEFKLEQFWDLESVGI